VYLIRKFFQRPAQSHCRLSSFGGSFGGSFPLSPIRNSRPKRFDDGHNCNNKVNERIIDFGSRCQEKGVLATELLHLEVAFIASLRKLLFDFVGSFEKRTQIIRAWTSAVHAVLRNIIASSYPTRRCTSLAEKKKEAAKWKKSLLASWRNTKLAASNKPKQYLCADAGQTSFMSSLGYSTTLGETQG